MGVPADAAESHAAALHRGSVVVAVHLTPENNATGVMDILRKYHGRVV
jgi:hypothetical protein